MEGYAVQLKGGTKGQAETGERTAHSIPASLRMARLERLHFPQYLLFAGSKASGAPTIIAVTPNFKNPYTINTAFQIQRELTQNDSLTLGYWCIPTRAAL